MEKRIYLFAVLLLTFAHLSAGNKPYVEQIQFLNTEAKAGQGKVSLTMKVKLDDLSLQTQHSLRLTPILVGEDDLSTVEFPSLIVNGNTRNKIHTRAITLNNENPYKGEIYDVIKRKNRKSQEVDYDFTLPSEPWMQNARLMIREEVTGCAACEVTENILPLIQLAPPFKPEYRLIYVMPEAEVKTRSDRHTATLNFKVDRYELLRNYRENEQELAKVDRVIAEVKNNDDLKITEFTVSGYASPEGNAQHNLNLSRNRANAFANYLSETHGMNRSLFEVEGYGEDWNSLRVRVANSFLEKKQEILAIIDNEPNKDARDAKIRNLDGGVSYKFMLDTYYPFLRRTEYTIAYVVRPFNVEEAKKLIKTNPKLLSLNEMFLVAQAYEPTSKEFKEVFDVAVRMYPNDPIAILNSAAADIEAGNYQEAVSRLEKLDTNAQAWNNLGVAYARLGKVEEAKKLFEEAAKAGNQEAIHNKEQIVQYINDQL